MGFETLTCPKCGGRFDVDSLLFVRAKEFPCPYCDAVLSFVNREKILRKEKTISIPVLLLFFFDFWIISFLFPSTQDEYAFIMLFLTISPNGLVLIGAIWMSYKVNKEIRLVTVRSRPSCGNCGYITTMENASFCARCGAKLLLADNINTNRCERAPVPEQSNYDPQTEETSKCMICLEDLRPHDNIARCPSCGSAFHTTHLLEYLHVHRGCPICSEPIDEVALTLPNESTQTEEDEQMEASSP